MTQILEECMWNSKLNDHEISRFRSVVTVFNTVPMIYSYQPSLIVVSAPEQFASFMFTISNVFCTCFVASNNYKIYPQYYPTSS